MATEDSDKVEAICQRAWEEPDIDEVIRLLSPLLHAKLDERGRAAFDSAFDRIWRGSPARSAKPVLSEKR